MDGRTTDPEVTADYVYIRLHGPDTGKYGGSYSAKQLGTWAERIDRWRSEGMDVYCYFDNDEAGHAVKNAQMLLKCLS
jgi:uncharacterized protein YecE (DUF72 family)